MTCHGLAHNITLVRIDVFPRGLPNGATTLRRRSVARRCDTPLAGKCTAPEVPLEWKICGQVKGSLSQPLRMRSICGLSARRPSDFAWGASFQQRCFSRSATFLNGLQMGGSCAPPNPVVQHEPVSCPIMSPHQQASVPQEASVICTWGGAHPPTPPLLFNMNPQHAQ